MSLKPWLPVPITARVIRLLGAGRPASPKRVAGDDRGKRQGGRAQAEGLIQKTAA